MHSLSGKKGVLLAGLLAGLVALPSALSAKPEPGAHGRSFRLFARSLGAMTINRVYCGLATTGEVCVDSTNSSTVGGGFWPKGTPDQYNFNSGLQLAGVIGGTKPANPWGGDTTGAFFFDPKGTTQHGLQVQPIYNSTNPSDVAAWPAAAMVPQGDAEADVYNPILQGKVNASQGDIWFMSWEGDPGQNAGRPHPLGIVVETRGMGWNFPAGNQDIIYFVYTFYNVTSTNPADYSSVRPSMQPILLSRAQAFQQLNNAKFGITLPPGGYTINNLFAAFARDDDVSDASRNFSSVNLPFALGYTYAGDFNPLPEWQLDPGIFGPPFFAGVGFTGAKYLKSPTGPGEIQLFSNTINGQAFADAVNDPRDVKQLFRYLSGTLSVAQGDRPCNTGNPFVTHICYINNNNVTDMRFFQSSTPLTLGPGQFGSIVVAYIYAAPVKVGSFTLGSSPLVKPNNARLLDPRTLAGRDSLLASANLVDSMTGFAGWTDVNGNCPAIAAVPDTTVGCAEQNEFKVIPGSLLGKAKVAQAVFDNKFLLPAAPDAPNFFLVPGDNQVTVAWKPSASEQTGDPYFQIVKDAKVLDAGGNLVSNALYDPNYREFDVEGYRIYRGRVDAQSQLQLVAQFDYAGTSFDDFLGVVNPTPGCAPELAIFTDCSYYNAPEFVGGVQNGIQKTQFQSYPITGTFVQSLSRTTLANGTAVLLKADTAVTGGATGLPGLKDTGVPFVYVDHNVRNNFRYFYAVTAFDVNSAISAGVASLESAKITKAVVPTVTASNQVYQQTYSQTIVGRGVTLTDNTLPTIDPATGKFSKPFPPSDAVTGAVAQLFVPQLIKNSGSAVIRLDSIQLGDPYGSGAPVNYFYTGNPGTPGESHFSTSQAQSQTDGIDTARVTFPAVAVDPSLAALYGGDPSFRIPAGASFILEGAYFTTVQGRACINSDNVQGDDLCSYNGARWFDGPSPAKNEVKDNPTAPGNQSEPAENAAGNFVPPQPSDFNNAGQLTGVTSIWEGRSYLTLQNTYRNVEAVMGGAARAADMNVYWGAGGKVDSVIDVTHNVPVPFDSLSMGGGWGILNQASGNAGGSKDARPGLLTLADWGCVQPMYSLSGAQARLPCTAAQPFVMTQTAVPGPIGLSAGTTSSISGTNPTARPNNGFSMYVPGHIFMFELTGGAVPAAGAVWTVRTYTGITHGGNGGDAGDEGPYSYEPHTRTFSAVGAEIHLNYDVVNQAAPPTIADLSKVHTVPDPYYVTDEFEQTTDNKIIQFVNLPQACTIRIYSSSGVLVALLEHNSAQSGGSEAWNVRNRNNQVVASGVYFYHIEAGDARRVGRFTVVNFAQ